MEDPAPVTSDANLGTASPLHNVDLTGQKKKKVRQRATQCKETTNITSWSE